MSSTCAASSSMVCAGRSAAPVRRACARTIAFQSCVRSMTVLLRELHARDLPERGDEPPPVGALLGEHAPPGLGDPIVAAPPLAGLLDPASLDPAAILEPVQRGVERREREPAAPARARLDELRDLVPVMAL